MVSGLTGDSTDAIIIAVIVALSVGLGFNNEYRAAVAVEQLHERIRRQAVVRRDGRQQNVDIRLTHDDPTRHRTPSLRGTPVLARSPLTKSSFT